MQSKFNTNSDKQIAFLRMFEIGQILYDLQDSSKCFLSVDFLLFPMDLLYWSTVVTSLDLVTSIIREYQNHELP